MNRMMNGTFDELDEGHNTIAEADSGFFVGGGALLRNDVIDW